LLPFARKIKLGSLLEFEREVDKLHREVEGIGNAVMAVAAQVTAISSSLSLQTQTSVRQNMIVKIEESVRELRRDTSLVGTKDAEGRPDRNVELGGTGSYGIGRASSDIRALLKHLIKESNLPFPPTLLDGSSIEQMAGFLLAHEIIDAETVKILAVFGTIDFLAVSGGAMVDQQFPYVDELTHLLLTRLKGISVRVRQPSSMPEVS